MFIKLVSFIFLSVVVFSSSYSSESSLTIEVVKSKKVLLSQENIKSSEIKLDELDKPYIDLTLTAKGVAQVASITEALKGETVNIWLSQHPVSLSVIINSAITSSNIRIPVDDMQQAQAIHKALHEK